MATEEEVELAQKLADLENQARTSTAAKKKLAEEIRTLNEQQLVDLLKRNDLNDKLVARLEQARDTLKNSLDFLKKSKKETEEIVNNLTRTVDELDKGYKKTVLLEEKNKAVKDLRKAEIDMLKAQAKTLDGITDKEAQRLQHLEELDKRLATFGNAASDIAQGLFSGDASGITGAISSISNSMKGDLSDSIRNTVNGAESLGAGLKAAGKQMGALALFSLIEQTVTLSTALLDAENAFMKATGASEDFARSITTTYEEGRKFTATAEDMSNAGASLFNTFADFTFQDKETREGLIKTGAVLDKLGISNDNFAQSIVISTKALGMSAEEAGQSMLDLEKFARELGVSPERLSGQFLEAGDTLAKLGENGDEAFRDLAAASKITNLEVSKLLNIVNQFDTFEGAARQAGKLNAALGGNFVNAMDLMMETDPTARFEQIRDAILDTGLSFDEMSYYQKNFYKDALGLDSVGDLALMLSGNMDAVSEETKKTSQDFEDAAERAKTLASFQEQLNAVFAQMIPILSPLIDGLREMLTFLSDNAGVIKVLGGALAGFAFGPVGAVVGALAMLIDSIKVGTDKVSALGLIIEGIFAPFIGLFSILKDASDFFIEAAGGMDKVIQIAEDFAPVLKGIGMIIGIALLVPLIKAMTAVKATVAVITLLAGAIRSLMDTFAEKNSPSFFDMFTGGLLVNSLEAVTKVFSKVKSGFEVIGEAVKSVTIKIKNMIETIGSMKDAVMNSWLAQTAIKGYNMAFGADDDEVGNVQGPAQMTAKAATTAAMSNLKENMIAAQAAQAGRTAAPTAANTNISQTSSKTTYVNSGPETAVFDVRIGDEKLGRVVQKISNKNISNSMAGRN